MSGASVGELVGVDVGGTFTDFVWLRGGRIEIHKEPTTPADQSEAVSRGIRALGVGAAASIVHGTTVATNALLERRGLATALITTRGFADVLVIGRQNRPHLYALWQERPAPLVDDDWRLEVAERLTHDGTVLEPLDLASVEALPDRIQRGDIRSVAVVLLFSYRNPEHEQALGAFLRERLPDIPITLSTELLPEYREYERTSTTTINAYVRPLVERYLDRLEGALDDRYVFIMQSNGGTIRPRVAAEQAARLVLSGPAGGVVGALEVARRARPEAPASIITFDMGGTSTDVALCDDEVPVSAESIIGDLPLRLPTVDIHTVGAGGGSIAYVDLAGILHVGPRSAGAVPGPVCYGQGGEEPTVTDANLVLGRLSERHFLKMGESSRLDGAAAEAALARLGDALGLSAEEAAIGVIRVANATMERALRKVSVERGHDPRSYTLVPFGGAGPLHACDLAEALAIPLILVPPQPGVLSAYGLAVADTLADASRSILRHMTDLQSDPRAVQKDLDELGEHLRASIGITDTTKSEISAFLDLRYTGQSYELTTPVTTPLSPETIYEAAETFHGLYERRYGVRLADTPVEAVTLRARLRRRRQAIAPPGAMTQDVIGAGEAERAGAPAIADAIIERRPVWFAATGPEATICLDRDRLPSGAVVRGPAIVHQYDTTVVISPAWTGRVDLSRNLWLEHIPTR